MSDFKISANDWKRNIEIMIEEQNELKEEEINRLNKLNKLKEEKKKEIDILDSEILKNSTYIKKNIENYAKNTSLLLKNIKNTNDFESMFMIYKKMYENALDFFSRKEFVDITENNNIIDSKNTPWLKLILPMWSLEKYNNTMLDDKNKKVKEYDIHVNNCNTINEKLLKINSELEKLKKELYEITIFSKKISVIRNN